MNEYILFEWIVPIGFACWAQGSWPSYSKSSSGPAEKRTNGWNTSKMKSGSPKLKIT